MSYSLGMIKGEPSTTSFDQIVTGWPLKGNVWSHNGPGVPVFFPKAWCRGVGDNGCGPGDRRFRSLILVLLLNAWAECWRSHIAGGWTRWWYFRKEENALRRCNTLYRRGSSTDLHQWIWAYGRRAYHKWIRGWFTLVSMSSNLGVELNICSLRTIVPIYQSEVSPPNHVSNLFMNREVSINGSSARCSCLHGVYRQYCWLLLLCCKSFRDVFLD